MPRTILRNQPQSSIERRRASRAVAAAASRELAMMARRPAAAGSFRRSLRGGRIVERKFHDVALSFSFDTTGEVPATGQLALIPQGDTAITRDGRECIIKSIQIRAHLSLAPGAAATVSGNTQLYLVLDTQCNKAAAAVTDVFTEDTLAKAMINLDNSKRFRIIKHWVHRWNPPAGATTAYNSVNQTIEYFKPCNIKMTYNSTTGAITEITQNNLFLIAGATAAIDDLVTVSGNCRLRFVG